jgi:hypothetical protein
MNDDPKCFAKTKLACDTDDTQDDSLLMKDNLLIVRIGLNVLYGIFRTVCTIRLSVKTFHQIEWTLFDCKLSFPFKIGRPLIFTEVYRRRDDDYGVLHSYSYTTIRVFRHHERFLFFVYLAYS